MVSAGNSEPAEPPLQARASSQNQPSILHSALHFLDLFGSSDRGQHSCSPWSCGATGSKNFFGDRPHQKLSSCLAYLFSLAGWSLEGDRGCNTACALEVSYPQHHSNADPSSKNSGIFDGQAYSSSQPSIVLRVAKDGGIAEDQRAAMQDLVNLFLSAISKQDLGDWNGAKDGGVDIQIILEAIIEDVILPFVISRCKIKFLRLLSSPSSKLFRNWFAKHEEFKWKPEPKVSGVDVASHSGFNSSDARHIPPSGSDDEFEDVDFKRNVSDDAPPPWIRRALSRLDFCCSLSANSISDNMSADPDIKDLIECMAYAAEILYLHGEKLDEQFWIPHCRDLQDQQDYYSSHNDPNPFEDEDYDHDIFDSETLQKSPIYHFMILLGRCYSASSYVASQLVDLMLRVGVPVQSFNEDGKAISQRTLEILVEKINVDAYFSFSAFSSSPASDSSSASSSDFSWDTTLRSTPSSNQTVPSPSPSNLKLVFKVETPFASSPSPDNIYFGRFQSPNNNRDVDDLSLRGFPSSSSITTLKSRWSWASMSAALASSELVLHAEMQLVLFYALNPHIGSPLFGFIGTSKTSCWCCGFVVKNLQTSDDQNPFFTPSTGIDSCPSPSKIHPPNLSFVLNRMHTFKPTSFMFPIPGAGAPHALGSTETFWEVHRRLERVRQAMEAELMTSVKAIIERETDKERLVSQMNR